MNFKLIADDSFTEMNDLFNLGLVPGEMAARGNQILIAEFQAGNMRAMNSNPKELRMVRDVLLTMVSRHPSLLSRSEILDITRRPYGPGLTFPDDKSPFASSD